MTTQHTHSEHSDADLNVVEHSPVSETEIDTNSATPQFPQDPAAPADTSSKEETPLTQAAVGASNEGSQHTQNTSQEVEQKNDSGTANHDYQDVPTAEPVAPYLSSSLVVEEEVRPFTDFIEEFRQSEARFSDSVQKYQSSPLSASSSTPSVMDIGRDDEHTTSVLTTSVTHNVDEVEAVAQQTPAQASTIEHTPTIAEAQTPVASETTETTPTVTPPATRPVSPLLRPATPRGRTPRHTGSRHHETPPVAATPTATPVETTETTPTVDAAPVAAEPPAEEQPRPARRYRFDRPSKVNPPSAATTPSVTPQTPPLQSRTDENKDVVGRDTTAVPFRPTNGHGFNGQVSEKESAVPQPVKQPAPQQVAEPSVAKQPAAPELPMAENTPAPGTSATPDERRRRHGQDRQRVKEQPQPTTAPVTLPTPSMEVVLPIAATTTPAASVSSQDSEESSEELPPLEYSELQKASSRRRRRRHTPGSVATPAASTPLAATPKAVTVVPDVAPAPVVTTPPLPPVAPAAPVVTPRSVAPSNTASSASPFTLTSGFTVNQMNQTHEGRNPFMGPDPSPARGTQAAQNVRSIRTDAQRTPAYPVRTTEATSASVHQLANVVSQAVQTQTDRMIAELRRSNQGPTNISVSMPPFPSNERVGVFVDVANLLYSARTLRMTVDFGKLLDFLRGNRRLVRAQAYCPTSPQPGDEQMFLQAVKGLGYRITTKNYKTFSSGAKKADLDLDLCMDVVRLVDGRAVDCIVLVSGDSDFMPMLDYCSDHGVRVEVAAFDEAMSATLRQSCDLFINLSMLEEIRA